jgi:Haem-binding domain
VRDSINLSRWNEYTDEERREFASRVARSTSGHVMPPKYVWTHQDAKLSSAELDELKEWAHH